MPHKDPEVRRAWEQARRDAIKADPVRLAKKRRQGRLAQRRRMKDPKKRALQNACTKAWRERDDNGLNAHVKNKYGIDGATYAKMHAAQKGLCAICRQPERTREPRSGTTRRLAVDHCHETGQVRGLLCYNCNVGIGMFKHAPTTLAAAIGYLKGGTSCEGV